MSGESQTTADLIVTLRNLWVTGTYPAEAADVIEKLLSERDRYESPAWKANDLLNERVEICYQALEQISERHPNAGTIGDIARAALEAAANVQ